VQVLFVDKKRPPIDNIQGLNKSEQTTCEKIRKIHKKVLRGALAHAILYERWERRQKQVFRKHKNLLAKAQITDCERNKILHKKC
jgi:hypothetical protein